jgi:adhesin/invasin
MITLFGTGLASARADASSVPLPTDLNGTKVRVNHVLIPLIVVLSTQINAQLPYEIGVGNATVTVELNGVVSAPFSFSVQATEPGIFVYGDNRAVAQNVAADGSVTLNTADNPVIPGHPMVIYLTGEGALDHPVASGAAAVSDPLSHPAAAYSVKVGTEAAVVDFVGMTPGLVALGQANIHIPDGLKPGDYPVVITIGGQHSNGPNISVGKKP